MPSFPSTNSSQYTEVSPYQVLIENDGSGNPLYVGESSPGAPSSGATWRIKKIAYSGGYVVSVKYADGDELFNNIWDNRASLTYS